MTSSDGNSTTRPLRRRKSKRFDRTGGTPLGSGAPVVEDADEPVVDEIPEPVSSTIDAEPPQSPSPQSPSPSPDPVPTVVAAHVHSDVHSSGDTGDQDSATSRIADTGLRNRTLDELATCGRCGHDVSSIDIEVDGRVLIMESCDNCDTRRWQLAGKPIELQQALDHVGQHAGRRR